MCKNFWSWATSFVPMILQNMAYFSKITYVPSNGKQTNEVGQLQKNFDFLEVWNFNFNIYFEAREAIKTRWDRAFSNLTNKKRQFLSHSVRQQSALHDIYPTLSKKIFFEHFSTYSVDWDNNALTCTLKSSYENWNIEVSKFGTKKNQGLEKIILKNSM